VFDSGSIDLLDRISYSRRHQPSRSHRELQGLALDGETRLGVYFFSFFLGSTSFAMELEGSSMDFPFA